MYITSKYNIRLCIQYLKILTYWKLSYSTVSCCCCRTGSPQSGASNPNGFFHDCLRNRRVFTFSFAKENADSICVLFHLNLNGWRRQKKVDKITIQLVTNQHKFYRWGRETTLWSTIKRWWSLWWWIITCTVVAKTSSTMQRWTHELAHPND